MITLNLTNEQAVALIDRIATARAVDRLCGGDTESAAFKTAGELAAKLQLGLANELESLGSSFHYGWSLAESAQRAAWANIEARVHAPWYYAVNGMSGYLDSSFAVAAGHAARKAG